MSDTTSTQNPDTSGVVTNNDLEQLLTTLISDVQTIKQYTAGIPHDDREHAYLKGHKDAVEQLRPY